MRNFRTEHCDFTKKFISKYAIQHCMIFDKKNGNEQKIWELTVCTILILILILPILSTYGPWGSRWSWTFNTIPLLAYSIHTTQGLTVNVHYWYPQKYLPTTISKIYVCIPILPIFQCFYWSLVANVCLCWPVTNKITGKLEYVLKTFQSAHIGQLKGL